MFLALLVLFCVLHLIVFCCFCFPVMSLECVEVSHVRHACFHARTRQKEEIELPRTSGSSSSFFLLKFYEPMTEVRRRKNPLHAAHLPRGLGRGDCFRCFLHPFVRLLLAPTFVHYAEMG
jgi:hypothetical protein